MSSIDKVGRGVLAGSPNPAGGAKPSPIPAEFADKLAHALAHVQGAAPTPVSTGFAAAAPHGTTSGAVVHAPVQGKSAQMASLHERALALLARRQELIASNIANADTPNYKAMDIDVQEALRLGYTAENVPVKYHVPSQSNLDGNTVEMDVERAKFAENTIKYRFALDRVSGYYKEMAELLRNLTQ